MKLRILAAWFRWTPLHPQWLLGRIRAPKDLEHLTGVVLDVGAADRWVERHLSKSVHYIALDYPATGLELYSARPDVFADGTRLPLRDASIDAVICFEVIEHVRNPVALLAEIARVLKPCGRVFLSMPFLYPIHDAPYDYQRYTLYGLQQLIEQSGLQLVSMKNKSNAIHIAAVLGCLAIAGGVAKTNSLFSIVLAPLALLLILLINVTAFFFGLIWPNWDAMTFGYELSAVKSDKND